MESTKFGVFLNHPDAKMPTKAHPTDAGFDLSSVEYVNLSAGERKVVATGVHLTMDVGWEAQIRPRSGNAAKLGLTIVNSPGTIDCFTEKMKISTIDGEKTIRDISLNDVCLSMNSEGDIVKNPILAIVDIGEKDIIQIETNDGILEVTENTKVYTVDGIKLAKDLKEDDEIIISPV